MNERPFLGHRVFATPCSGPQVAKNTVGDMAERLVCRALGARLWDARLPAFEVPAHVATESDGSPYGLLPDAWWAPQSALLEVKAGIARFYTTERQWKAYRWARDTAASGLPIEKPRIFYAFVGYNLSKRSDKFSDAHEVVDDALRNLRYIVVADSRLVEHYIGQSGSYHTDHEGPLSSLLGIWHAHWNVRAHRLQAWADDPRGQLDALKLTRWRAGSFRPTLRLVGRELQAAGWATMPDIPAVVIAPARRARPGPAILPRAQTDLGFDGCACPDCGFWAPPGDCPACGTFTAF